MTKIGFIGLGNMGGPMAANLSSSGYAVAGYDLSRESRATAAARGVDIKESLADTVAGNDVIITMLPTGSHVRSVLVEEGGVLDQLSGDVVVLDCSTIDIASALAVHDVMRERGITFCDAPVSGGVTRAEAASLTFMVGGTAEAFTAAEPVLEHMGVNIVHAGHAGTGQAAKICNNMLFGTTLVAVAEAFTLAEKLGLDAHRLFEIVTSSSGDNWAIRNFCPWPGVVPGSASDDGYAARFSANLMSKDLHLAVDAAQLSELSLPLSAQASDVFAKLAVTEGHLDASSVIHQVRPFQE